MTDLHTHILPGMDDGAKDLEIRYAFLNINNAVTGAEVVAAIGNDNVVIVDVRNDEKYDAGHLNGSLHIAVFDANNKPVGTADDALAKTFVETAKGNVALQGKDIYILCNGGQRGARAATVLLTDAGYSVDDIFTITGGAGNEDVKAAFVKTVSEYKFVAGSDAVNADPAKTFIIDVRTEANYAKGHLANSVNWPLFDANGVTNGKDALAQNFTQKVIENAALLAGKNIYAFTYYPCRKFRPHHFSWRRASSN